MSSTVVFIHGTGVRNVSGAIAQIRRGVSEELGWDTARVLAVEWGTAVGANDLSIKPALPSKYTGRGVGDSPADGDEQSAIWELLMADPYAELRIMAVSQQPGGSANDVLNPTAAPLSVDITERVKAIDVNQDALSQSGINPDVLAAARDRLVNDAVLGQAADAGFDISELASAAARALVADSLQQYLNPTAPDATSTQPDGEASEPRSLYDADSRDDAVEALARTIAPEITRSVITDLGKRAIANIATRVGVHTRSWYMNLFSDFLRDVARYLSHGEEVRNYIADQLRQPDIGSPLIVLAHSLGGIAAVDLLSDQTVMQGHTPLPVDLLVTVGSQAPYLYLLDSLHKLSPKSPGKPPPFEPWLNIYNPEDLLSFCAGPVFPNSARIQDRVVDSGVPFPMSHSAYWTQKRLYELMREALQL